MSPEVEKLLRPLSARSVIASALLGTHPPRLPGRLLVAFAEEFGIGGGTARVALSRMLERGELTNSDGVYALAGGLALRQARQDLGRSDAGGGGWDGTWEQAVVVESGRTARDRHRLRQALTAARLGEVREGVWVRPANLEPAPRTLVPSDLSTQLLWLRATPVDEERWNSAAATVFDTESWSATATELLAAMRPEPDGLAGRFRLAAAVLQHLTHDALLPVELYPAGWPADRLRAAYREYEAELQTQLRTFFATAAA